MSTINGTPEYVPKPKSHPRRSAEAHAYALRVRDGTGNLFDTNGSTQNGNSSPRGGVRLPTEEAKRNYAMNKGCMSEMMGGVSKNGDSAHAMPTKTEGFRTAESNKGEAMRTLMGKYGEIDLSDRPIPKLKGEDAQHYAERNHGTLGILFHNYGNENVPDNPPVQRLGHGADENAKKHLGSDMGPLLRMEGEKTVHTTKLQKLHQESQNGSWDEIPPPSRIRPEAEEILARYNNSAMREIMGMGNDTTVNGGTTTTTNNNNNHHHHYNHSSSSSSNKSNHKSTQRAYSGVMTERNGNFLNGYNNSGANNTVSRGRVSPSRTKPEAMEYFNKNKHSEVGAIMRGEPLPATPNSRKVNRNLVRSEEW